MHKHVGSMYINFVLNFFVFFLYSYQGFKLKGDVSTDKCNTDIVTDGKTFTAGSVFSVRYISSPLSRAISLSLCPSLSLSPSPSPSPSLSRARALSLSLYMYKEKKELLLCDGRWY